MAKISTADCKKALVEFAIEHPHHITDIYGRNILNIPHVPNLLRDAYSAKMWKREHKLKVGHENAYTQPDDSVEIWSNGCYITKRGSDFTCERVFALNPDEYDSTVRYVVLENDSGVFVGEYVGD